MAFADFVAQIFGKRKIWLYKIVLPGVATYHVTSRGSDYESSVGKPDASFLIATNWTSTAILNNGVTQTTRSERAEVKVSMPTTHEITQAVIAYGASEKITVSIWQTFLDDPDEEYKLKFTGRIVNYEPGRLAVTFVCEEGFTEMSRSSVAQVLQRPCRHAHYFTTDDGGGCGLDVDDWKQSVEVTAVSLRTLTIPLAALQPDGTFTAGILFWGGNEYFVESHVGETVVLESSPIGMVALLPETADIVPGCNLTPANCLSFSNILNFGGFWFMTESPFDGRALS